MSKRAPWELRGKDAFNEVDYENGTMLGAVLYGDETCPVCKGARQGRADARRTPAGALASPPRGALGRPVGSIPTRGL
jgi:hypothetical protein